MNISGIELGRSFPISIMSTNDTFGQLSVVVSRVSPPIPSVSHPRPRESTIHSQCKKPLTTTILGR